MSQVSESVPADSSDSPLESSRSSVRSTIAAILDQITTRRLLALPLSDWVCSIILGAIVLSWMHRVGGPVTPITALLLFSLFFFVAAAGRLLCHYLRLPHWVDLGFPTVFVVGFFPIGFVFALIRVGTGISFGFLSVILAVAVICLLWRHRMPSKWFVIDPSSLRFGLISTMLAAIVVTFRVALFCFPPVLVDGTDLVVKMGDNEFYHASFVTFLDAPGPAWKYGSFTLAGRPAFFYHFASYVGGAWFRSLSHATSMSALFGMMTPLGVLLSSMAAYAFMASWFRPRLGFWALALFWGLPDISGLTTLLTPFKQSMYAFPFLVLPATPANGYGLASSILSILIATIGLREKRFGLVGLGLAFAVSTILWKAQLGVNVCLALGVLLLPWLLRLIRPSVIVPPLVILLLILGYSRLLFDSARTPTAQLDSSFGELMAEWHLSTLPEASIIHRLEPWMHGKTVGAFFVRILLNALASFGVLFLVWLIVAAWQFIRCRRLSLPMLATGASVLVFLLLGALLAENRTGFRFEMQFSPYFLPLLLMELTLLGVVADSAIVKRIRKKPVPLMLGFLAAVPLSIPAILVVQDRTMGYPYAKGLSDCAVFIRKVGDPFDVVQDSANDPPGLLSGLTERRSYVGILAFQDFIGMDEIVGAYERRRAANDKLLAATSREDIRKINDMCGIRWYILWPDAETSWPDNLLASDVFESGGYRVYDLKELSEDRP